MIWKTISHHPDYEVSDEGQVRRRTANHKLPAGALLQQAKIKGYPVVSLGQDHRTWKVHRLVADAFLPPPGPGQTLVAHNDGARANNVASNLRWATQKENLSDRIAHGTEIRGARNGRAKLTTDQVIEIRRRYKRRHPTDGAAALAKEFGVTDVAVIKAFRGENWAKLV